MNNSNFVANGEILRDFIGTMSNAKVVSDMDKYMKLISITKAAQKYAKHECPQDRYIEILHIVETQAMEAIFNSNEYAMTLCQAIMLDILEGVRDVNNLPEEDLDILNNTIITELSNAFDDRIGSSGFALFVDQVNA